jgi:hypothetical protein
MRSSLLLTWTSAAVVWAASLAVPSELIRVERSQAGGPIRFNVDGDGDSARKVRFEVRRRDGSRTSLPSVVIEPPFPPPGGSFEGPTIPADAAGGQLVVELIDPETGQKISKDLVPIGF